MIILCEPQCIGFEHAEFNAAFIKVVDYAFNDKIIFLAEKEHLDNVKVILSKSNIKIEYKEIKPPIRSLTESKRFLTEFKLIKNVFNLANKLQSDKVFFCSITTSTLISIKIMLRIFRKIKTIVIPHSILESIYNAPPLSRERFFWLREWISILNTNRLKYLVLGDTIKEELDHEIPKIEEYVYSIEFPFFYRNNQLTSTEEKILFGFLGVGYIRKGIDIFFKIASEIKKKNKYADFILVGHLADKIDFENEHVSIPSLNTPISNLDYDMYFKRINYALFFHKKDYYRLSASGVFFDAISYLKPIIALRNPFFEHYFKVMGDIGYLCDSYEEMENLILKIVENNPNERYLKQQMNLLNGRKKLNFQNIAQKLKKINI